MCSGASKKCYERDSMGNNELYSCKYKVEFQKRICDCNENFLKNKNLGWSAMY